MLNDTYWTFLLNIKVHWVLHRRHRCVCELSESNFTSVQAVALNLTSRNLQAESTLLSLITVQAGVLFKPELSSLTAFTALSSFLKTSVTKIRDCKCFNQTLTALNKCFNSCISVNWLRLSVSWGLKLPEVHTCFIVVSCFAGTDLCLRFLIPCEVMLASPVTDSNRSLHLCATSSH